jgi:glutaredoxin 3
MTPTITVYTRRDCATCRQVKEYLEQFRLPYRERDVASDPAARLELEGMPVTGVPVILIGGEAVLGFDRARLDDLLKARGVLTGAP